MPCEASRIRQHRLPMEHAWQKRLHTCYSHDCCMDPHAASIDQEPRAAGSKSMGCKNLGLSNHSSGGAEIVKACSRATACRWFSLWHCAFRHGVALSLLITEASLQQPSKRYTPAISVRS
jgi:hypothetical protein